jgi:hypothetical protein
MRRALSTNGQKENALRILVGKPEESRPLGRLRHRWKDNNVTCLEQALPWLRYNSEPLHRNS